MRRSALRLQFASARDAARESFDCAERISNEVDESKQRVARNQEVPRAIAERCHVVQVVVPKLFFPQLPDVFTEETIVLVSGVGEAARALLGSQIVIAELRDLIHPTDGRRLDATEV